MRAVRAHVRDGGVCGGLPGSHRELARRLYDPREVPQGGGRRVRRLSRLACCLLQRQRERRRRFPRHFRFRPGEPERGGPRPSPAGGSLLRRRRADLPAPADVERVPLVHRVRTGGLLGAERVSRRG